MHTIPWVRLRLYTMLLVLLAGIFSCNVHVMAVTPWQIAPDGADGLELLQDGVLACKMTMRCWGPAWKYFMFSGAPKKDAQGGRTATYTTKIGGTNIDISHAFSIRRTNVTKLTADFSFTAKETATLTGIAMSLTNTQGYTKAIATLDDGAKQETTPAFPRGALGGKYKQLALLKADGTQLTIDITPPRTISCDNEARISLVGATITGGEAVHTTLIITTPAEMTFYALIEDCLRTHITPEWFPYASGPGGVPVDLSFLNKGTDGKYIPAGARGFVKVKGDGFIFEDGTPARFWGVNVTAGAALAGGTRAEQIAERLSRLGVNVVRMHHLDSVWAGNTVIDYQAVDKTTQHLSPTAMKNVDKLIFELKQRGIYIILDPWVGREYREGDNIPGWDKMGGGNFGLHPFIFFDLPMQALQHQFQREFWTHKNELTGIAYQEEPALCLTEVCNEALFNNEKIGQLDPYKTNFINLYHDWAVKDGADPNVGDKIWQLNYPRDNQRFYIDIMQTYYAQQVQFMRDELGLKMPINASNWTHWPWDLYAQTGVDFMDNHHYYGGDGIGPGSGLGGLWTADTAVKRGGDSVFAPSAAAAILGQPMTLSECGNNPTKTYRGAYYPGLAAMACFQEWDSITGYAFTQSAVVRDILLPYEFESDPATIAGIAAGSLIFRRQDVQPAKELALMLINENERYAMHYENDAEGKFQNTPEFRAMLETHKVNVLFADKVPGAVKPVKVMDPVNALNYVHPNTELRSDTGELWRDWKTAVAIIDTPRTQAVIGNIGLSKKTWKTKDCVFTVSTSYATVVLSSLSEQPITRAQKLLLTTIARAENNGMAFNLSETNIVLAGTAPIMAEPVVGSIIFATNAAILTAYPIASDGKRGPAIPLTIKEGKATLDVKAEYKTLFYEIESEK